MRLPREEKKIITPRGGGGGATRKTPLDNIITRARQTLATANTSRLKKLGGGDYGGGGGGGARQFSTDVVQSKEVWPTTVRRNKVWITTFSFISSERRKKIY